MRKKRLGFWGRLFIIAFIIVCFGLAFYWSGVFVDTIFFPNEDSLLFIASVGQGLEALIVLAGAPLLLLQMLQISSEQTSKDWEALQWAMSLFDIPRLDYELGNFKNNPDRVYMILHKFNLLAGAVDDGYLKLDSVMSLWAPHLSWLHIQLDGCAQTARDSLADMHRDILDKNDWKPLRGLAAQAYARYPNPPDFFALMPKSRQQPFLR